MFPLDGSGVADNAAKAAAKVKELLAAAFANSSYTEAGEASKIIDSINDLMTDQEKSELIEMSETPKPALKKKLPPLVKEADPELEALFSLEEEYKEGIIDWEKFAEDVKKKAFPAVKKTVAVKKAVSVPKDDSTMLSIPLIKDTVLGDFYPIDAGGGNIVRFFIHKDISLPPGTFLYDFFASGEIYYNPMPGNEIGAAKDALTLLYRHYFMRNTSLCTMPTTAGQTAMDLTVSHNGPNGVLGWLFGLNTFFESVPSGETSVSEDVPSQTVNTSHYIPICQYYSDPEKDIYSSHYSYGNHVPGIQSCCNKSVQPFGASSTVVTCGWATNGERQSNCTGYTETVEITSKVTVKATHAPTTTDFELQHFDTLSGVDVYSIKNVTDDTLVQRIVVPEDVTDEEALAEVSDVFNEYLACYIDGNELSSDLPVADVSQPKNGFIKTLLKV